MLYFFCFARTSSKYPMMEKEGRTEVPTVSIEDVRSAAKRIEGKAHRTPILSSSTLDELAGRQLFFKCENLQKVSIIH